MPAAGRFGYAETDGLRPSGPSSGRSGLRPEPGAACGRPLCAAPAPYLQAHHHPPRKFLPRTGPQGAPACGRSRGAACGRPTRPPAAGGPAGPAPLQTPPLQPIPRTQSLTPPPPQAIPTHPKPSPTHSPPPFRARKRSAPVRGRPFPKRENIRRWQVWIGRWWKPQPVRA